LREKKAKLDRYLSFWEPHRRRIVQKEKKDDPNDGCTRVLPWRKRKRLGIK